MGGVACACLPACCAFRDGWKCMPLPGYRPGVSACSAAGGCGKVHATCQGMADVEYLSQQVRRVASTLGSAVAVAVAGAVAVVVVAAAAAAVIIAHPVPW